MTKAKISDYNVSADENKEINNIGIQGSDPVYNMDNALRELMAQLAQMNAGTAPLDDTLTLAKSSDRTAKMRFKVEAVAASESNNTVTLTVPEQSGLLITDQTVGNYTSSNASTLEGEAGSYYLNASNLTGTISDARLPDVISSDITGNAASATHATNATTATNATAHIARVDNPHNVTKAQVGLGNVDNTSDADKPISTATQSALSGKLPLSGGTMAGDLNMNGHQITGVSLGGSLFKGENGTVGSSAGDIFRINATTLSTDTTIDANENASCTGPIAVASGVTLTINGTLAVI